MPTGAVGDLSSEAKGNHDQLLWNKRRLILVGKELEGETDLWETYMYTVLRPRITPRFNSTKFFI